MTATMMGRRDTWHGWGSMRRMTMMARATLHAVTRIRLPTDAGTDA